MRRSSAGPSCATRHPRSLPPRATGATVQTLHQVQPDGHMQQTLHSSSSQRASRHRCNAALPTTSSAAVTSMAVIDDFARDRQVSDPLCTLPRNPSAVMPSLSLACSRPVILYDGVCNLCNGAVDLMITLDPEGRSFRMAALQSPAGMRLLKRSGRRPDDISSIVLVEPGEQTVECEAVDSRPNHRSEVSPFLAVQESTTFGQTRSSTSPRASPTRGRCWRSSPSPSPLS